MKDVMENMSVGEYVLVNEEKVRRALYGTGRRDARTGAVDSGIGEDASEEALLVEYDRLGGLVLKNGLKVKTGSWFDFKEKKPRAKPEVKFSLIVDGQIVTATEEQAMAIKEAKEQAEEIKEQTMAETERRNDSSMKKPRKKKV